MQKRNAYAWKEASGTDALIITKYLIIQAQNLVPDRVLPSQIQLSDSRTRQ